MSFSIFMHFDGNCKDAIAFYAKVFNSPADGVMTYRQTPGGGALEADRDRIMYSCIRIFGANVMLSDISTGRKHVTGTNIAPTIGSDDMGELRRVFSELAAGGTIVFDIAETFFSKLYGMVTDKFGVTWHISHDSGE